jgi:hypothetical protein
VAVASGELRDGATAVLQALVDDGTLTQRQADAVEEAFTDAAEDWRAEAEERHEAWHEAAEAQREQFATTLEDLTGLTPDEVGDRVAGGESLRAIAGDQAAALEEALLAQRTAALEQAVTDGLLERADADALLETLPERVAAILDWVPGAGPPFADGSLGLGIPLGDGDGPPFGPGGRFGHGGMGGPGGLGDRGGFGFPGWEGRWDDGTDGSGDSATDDGTDGSTDQSDVGTATESSTATTSA